MIVVLVGRKRSGKDTVGERLCKEHGFKKISFAGPIKETARTLFGWEPDKEDDRHLPTEYGCTKREFLQWFGTEAMREGFPRFSKGFREKVGKDIWIDIAINKMKQGGDWVITDCRFINEAEKIRDYFGHDVVRIVKVERGDQTQGFWDKVKTWLVRHTPLRFNGAQFHPSEVEVDLIEYDVCIKNDLDLPSLYNRLYFVVQNWIKAGVLDA